MEQAIKEVEEANRRGPGRIRIATNRELDLVLNSDSRHSIKDALPCWSGTMAAYERAGVALGRYVEYEDQDSGIRHLFPVPKEFVRIKDAILLVDHPFFTIESDGRDRIVRAKKVSLLEGFPDQNDHYRPDPRYGIPWGEAILWSEPDARRLHRIGKRVGLAARHFYD